MENPKRDKSNIENPNKDPSKEGKQKREDPIE
jgi:hypothetical protein